MSLERRYDGDLLPTGTVLREKYRIEGVLGQGGMATVYSATHLYLSQRVALKALRADLAKSPNVVARFLREARAVSRLSGIHVARVVDVDTLHDGTPFIVMEHLEGSDLAVVRRARQLSVGEAVGYLIQACQAISEAHRLGIIHRDVKPANLFLATSPEGGSVVKVLDFGISKLTDDTQLTAEDVGMGSAEYMSPEQIRSATRVDPRSDVWSLGVTLYELCAGQTPFVAEGASAVLANILTREPAPPRTLRPDLPVGLEAVILRCLDKDPEKRFASADDLARALAPFARGASPASAKVPETGFPWRPILAGVMAIAVVAIVVIALLRKGDGSAGAFGRYELRADELVDHEADRTWQRRPVKGAMDWAAAKSQCAGAGGGFRLPSIGELESLYAVMAVDPPLDAEAFTATAVDVFWSSTAAGAGAAKDFSFAKGEPSDSVVSARRRVRCVK